MSEFCYKNLSKKKIIKLYRDFLHVTTREIFIKAKIQKKNKINFFIIITQFLAS